jgi:hypothetical protein
VSTGTNDDGGGKRHLHPRFCAVERGFSGARIAVIATRNTASLDSCGHLLKPSIVSSFSRLLRCSLQATRKSDNIMLVNYILEPIFW